VSHYEQVTTQWEPETRQPVFVRVCCLSALSMNYD